VDFVADAKAFGLANWQHFLLPAGFSDRADARISQHYLYDWHLRQDAMCHLLDTTLSSDMFRGRTVLFYGGIFVPEQPGKTGAVDKTREAFSWLPKLVLSMGASKVEAISDARSVLKLHCNWDIGVFADDEKQAQKIQKCCETQINVRYIKQLLICKKI